MIMILRSTKCLTFLVSDKDTFHVQNNAGTAISVGLLLLPTQSVLSHHSQSFPKLHFILYS